MRIGERSNLDHFIINSDKNIYKIKTVIQKIKTNILKKKVYIVRREK